MLNLHNCYSAGPHADQRRGANIGDVIRIRVRNALNRAAKTHIRAGDLATATIDGNLEDGDPDALLVSPAIPEEETDAEIAHQDIGEYGIVYRQICSQAALLMSLTMVKIAGKHDRR